MIGEFCVLRGYGSGVFTGYIEAITPNPGFTATALVRECRNIWSWQGAFTLIELANRGCSEASTISEASINPMTLFDIIQVHVCTKEAKENLQRSRNTSN